MFICWCSDYWLECGVVISHCVKVRGLFGGVGSLPPQDGFQGPNFSHQAWEQVPLLAISQAQARRPRILFHVCCSCCCCCLSKWDVLSLVFTLDAPSSIYQVCYWKISTELSSDYLSEFSISSSKTISIEFLIHTLHSFANFMWWFVCILLNLVEHSYNYSFECFIRHFTHLNFPCNMLLKNYYHLQVSYYLVLLFHVYYIPPVRCVCV